MWIFDVHFLGVLAVGVFHPVAGKIKILYELLFVGDQICEIILLPQ